MTGGNDRRFGGRSSPSIFGSILGLLLVVMSVWVCVAQEEERVMIPPSPYAIDLNSSNFYSTLSKGQWIVEFYEDWCGICQRVDKAWRQGAEHVVKNRNSSLRDSVQFARIRCTKNPHICLAHGVIAYPVIKYFHGDIEREWHHERTFENFVAFSSEITKDLPTVLESNSWAERESKLYKKRSYRMAFLYVGNDPTVLQVFRNAGRDFTDVADFLTTTDVEIARAILNTDDVSDSIWAVSGNPKKRYTLSHHDQSALSKFIRNHQYPFYDYISESEREYELMVSEKPILMVITFGYNEDEIKAMETVATTLDQYRLVHINALNLGTINWLNSLNISPHSAPRLVLWNTEDDLKYYSHSAGGSADIIAFIKDFIEGYEKGEYEPSGRIATFDSKAEKFLLWAARKSYPIAYFLGLCTVYPIGVVVAFAVITFIGTVVFVVYVISDKKPDNRRPGAPSTSSTKSSGNNVSKETPKKKIQKAE
eukprot:TRINITY_DN13071_c0_g1_i1.p1 TRINITY_DN13071_c0_g1~~TRINITY_DN13071_c0_g1_i1.p1  ORF type:complete len:510 (+),score=100.46 TRINITY_DN13071_c0_g1_i1:91-1530(+)